MPFYPATLLLLIVVLAGSGFYLKNKAAKIFVGVLLIGVLALGIAYPHFY